VKRFNYDLNSFLSRFALIKNVNIHPIHEKVRAGDNRDSGSKISPAKKHSAITPALHFYKTAKGKNSMVPLQKTENLNNMEDLFFTVWIVNL